MGTVNRLFSIRFSLVSLLLIGLNLSCSLCKHSPSPPDALPADSPANASYFVENEWVQLDNGLAEREAAPNSAARIRIWLTGEVYYGDLNYDRQKDAVVVLAYQGGGSGTFFYLAAALYENGGFSGKNSILLGDRVSSPAAEVQNGLITVTYLDRRRDESMATAPSQEQKRYFIMSDSRLQEIYTAADEAVYQGWLTIGHEVRSFLPCSESEELWLLGKSPALETITSAYGKATAGLPPYTPVFALLAGTESASPETGFGTDYRVSLSATRLIRLWLQGNCRSDFISLDTPLPGATVYSPITIKGQARGTWFFEGDFPVVLLDAQGRKIASGYASAQGEWMTEDFVRFEGSIPFNSTLSGQQGFLVLKKDNPAGLVQFDDALKIPVKLK